MPCRFQNCTWRSFAKMSAPIDDLLYDDDDDDDMSLGNTDMTSGFAQQSMGMLPPPGAVLSPQPILVQPPVGVIAPPHQAMAAPIAYTPSPTAPPPVMTQEEKIKKLFRLILERFPDKYKPLFEEVRTRQIGVKNDMNFIVDLVKRSLGEPIFNVLCQEVGGFSIPTSTPRTFPTQPTMKAEPVPTVPTSIPFSQALTTYQAAPTPNRPMAATLQPAQQRAPAPAAVVAPPSAATHQSTEASAKIRFARQLLAHSATCTTAPGECKAMAKCDDIKRFFKHSMTCGGGRECHHCEQLRTLVKLHATECTVGPRDRCPIPFCDTMRSNGPRQPSMKDPPANSPQSNVHPDLHEPQAVKKQVPPYTQPSPATQHAAPAAPTPQATATATPATTTQQTPKATDYGQILQMILHCQKCSLSSGCPAPGCSESKEYMREMQNPATTVVKAKTYLQVFNHYKQCPNKVTCPVCSVSLQPLPFATAPPQQPATNTGAAVAVPGQQLTPQGLTTKRPGTATSPRSPLDGGPAKKVKASPANSFAPSSVTKKALASNATAYLQQNHPGAIETYDLTEELAPTNANDLRREADVLTHTNIDPQVEKRIMLAGVPPKAKQLGPKRETWSELFQHQGLQQTMAKAFIAGGLQPQTGEDVTEVMGLALHEYLKQALEEMVEIAKQRNDAYANSIPRKQPPPPSSHPAKTAVEILRLSSDEHFNRQMQADQALRSELLEEGRKDESADKDKNNKRRKGKANPKAPPSASSTSKKDLMDKDEEDMDIDELARKDLKLKLTQEGSVMLEGRVNTSIAPNARRNKHEIQVTMEDAEYWLRSQKPYVDAKLFCRAMAARIHSKNL
ncbi:hypothetical protein, variant 1 [Aphanomyces invadans]|uniref:TAZ-type domain-containing protein n=1 Tax=Aphanomyces invadans TaxID=157072 RepID=A0A024UGP8_9STRA|nr:hypothetical protein, variant 1 [Aphanomyces invadans]ETW05047.1 hypothetical protein, variant 1 [Aphanomyces invadans]|eukprot:XP_008866485.1 hypothetical protein, variant 1 [Aphanomyces invadans]